MDQFLDFTRQSEHRTHLFSFVLSFNVKWISVINLWFLWPRTGTCPNHQLLHWPTPLRMGAGAGWWFSGPLFRLASPTRFPKPSLYSSKTSNKILMSATAILHGSPPSCLLPCTLAVSCKKKKVNEGLNGRKMSLACDSHMPLIKFSDVIFLFALIGYLLFFLSSVLCFRFYFMLSVISHLCQYFHSLLVIVYKVVTTHGIMFYIFEVGPLAMLIETM